MSKHTLHTSILLISLLSYSHASANIQFTACNPIKDSQGNLSSPCEKVLVGAAHIDFDAIKWLNRNTVGTVSIDTVGGSLGFTGNSIYFGPQPLGTWIFRSPLSVKIINPPFGSSLNHFFAPLEEKSYRSAENVVVIPSTAGSDQQFLVQGSGIADNEMMPAITLELAVSETEGKQITTSSCEDQVLCKNLGVPKNQSILLTLTPRVTRIPEGVQAINYALVNFHVKEKNTSCSKFQFTSLTENSWAPGNYFHYLDGDGPNAPQECRGAYPLLVSIGKPLKFRITNDGDTGTGYIQYNFYLNGHYDPLAPQKWPESHHSLRFSTATFPSPFTSESELPKPEYCLPATYNKNSLSAQLPCVIKQDNTQLSLDLTYGGPNDKHYPYWSSLDLKPSTCQPQNKEQCALLNEKNDLMIPVIEEETTHEKLTHLELKKYERMGCPLGNVCWEYLFPGLHKPIPNFVAMQTNDSSPTLFLDASLSRPDDETATPITSYQWEVISNGQMIPSSTNNQKTLTLPLKPGNYTIKLTVFDEIGETNSISQAITVFERPQEAHYLLSLAPGFYQAQIDFPPQHPSGLYTLSMEMLNETPINFITNSLWVSHDPAYYTTFVLNSPQRVHLQSQFGEIYDQQQPGLLLKKEDQIIYTCTPEQPCFNEK